MPTIAVDAMGGRGAPAATVAAAAKVSRSTRIDVALVGDVAAIDAELANCSYNPERLVVREVDDGEGTIAQRSIATCVEMVASGEAHALMTAGHPPDALLACVKGFEVLPGVRRAPLAAVYPTARRPGTREDFALILDVGATLRPTAEDLVSWARMGAAYASRISKVEAPTVALLSTRRDADAGPPEVVEAHRILAADSSIRFVGNIEGIDIPRGAADVVVCDGYVGQIVVGVLGGVGDALVDAARGVWEKRLTWRVGLTLLEGAVVKFRELTNHASYGGAPLLGFDRVAILALPGSEERTLANAIKLAAKAYRDDVVGAVQRILTADG